MIFEQSLFEQSGHLANYREDMFFALAGEKQYCVKPMNCPGHTVIYRTTRRSYRDLPMRLADFGRLHRYERSGVTAGLTRVRSFSQDDAHIFCTPDQVEEEIAGVIRMVRECFSVFGFDARVYLATRPEKSQGTVEQWENAEAMLRRALEKAGQAWTLNPGGGAFYAPKIDFMVMDALQREHQLSTVQADYTLPERFDLKYAAPEGGEARPVMIHRAMLGSLERFIGILVEHFAGAFPVWLAPVQAAVLPITDRVIGFAEKTRDRLKQAGLRVTIDASHEKIGHKIREAQLQKVPYMLVIGDREADSGSVSVRTRSQGDRGAMPLEEFAQEIEGVVRTRALTP
jgi:threonyl-tRNA synthetase